MKKWFDEEIDITYKDLFNKLLEHNSKDVEDDNDDSIITASAFNVVTDLYKIINNKFPYETLGKLKYVVGDALEPIKDGKPLICHICNDIGAWGKGFVMAISKKYPIVKEIYQNQIRMKKNNNLGDIQVVNIDNGTFIVNMIAQKGIYPKKDENGNIIQPIRYEALAECLDKVTEFIVHEEQPISVHMPRIGCGLAGGTWDKVEKIIFDILIKRGINVYVYDLKN